MSPCTSFIHHTLAFEQAFVTDLWQLLEPLYAADAVHLIEDGGPFGDEDRGPAAIADGLRRSVHTVDRRFDVRIPAIIEGPFQHDDRIWMRFRLTMRRHGLPDLVVEGEHETTHRDGLITDFREKLAPGHGERAARYLQLHDAALRPAGSAFTPVTDEDDLKELRTSINAILVRCYGMAKGQQDIAAAMLLCHPTFAVEAVAFRMASRNREETQLQLALFFQAFPDFQPTLAGLVADDVSAACWGSARMTHGGDLFGNPPSRQTATLPFSSAFEFRDGLLSREIFFTDLAALCDGIDLPMERLLPVVRMLSAAGAAQTGAA